MPAARPLLARLAAHGSDEPDERCLGGEALDHPRPALYLPVQALLHVVRAYAAAVPGREVEVRWRIGRGGLHDGRGASQQAGDEPARGLVHGAGPRRVPLGEDGVRDPAGRGPPGPRGDRRDDVALQMDDAALPCGAGEGLAHRAHDAAVRVGGHALHPVEAAFAEPAQEALPAGVGLGVDTGEADHPADPVLADGHGGGAGAVAPARHVGGVHPQVREALTGQVAPPQLGHPGVELGADAAHAVLG